jgi:hypothetical protein
VADHGFKTGAESGYAIRTGYKDIDLCRSKLSPADMARHTGLKSVRQVMILF